MINGDFRKMDIFKRKLGKLDPHLETLSALLGEETIELIKEGFDEERDPDGRPWKPLVLRKGRILSDTGGLRGSWHRKSTKAGFRVHSGKQYAVYQHGGTGIYGPRGKRIYPIRAKALKLGKYGYAKSVAGIPQRKMVPDNGRLPRSWEHRYQVIANLVLKKVFA